MYTWNQLGINEITNLYLYGDIRKPQDVRSEALIRAKGAETTVEIDAVSFMANGPGRFANAISIPVVQQFMEGRIYKPNGTRQTFSLAAVSALVGAKGANTDLSQSNYLDGTDDHALRTYVYQSSSFTLAQDAVFVIEADGRRHIEGLAILPFNDDFDFESDSLLSQFGNAYLEPRIDPTDIGRKVILKIDQASKAQVRRIDYTGANYAADSLRYQQTFSPVTGTTRLTFEMPQVVTDLWTQGSTRILDAEGRVVIHGTTDADNLSVEKLSKRPLYSALRTALEQNGAALVGGGGGDILTGGIRNDYLDGGAGQDILDGKAGIDQLFGGADNDIIIGGTGNDQIYGGTGFDTYIEAAGDGADTLVDTDGKGRIIINGASVNTAAALFIAVNGQPNTYKSPDGTQTLTNSGTWTLSFAGGSIDLGSDFASGKLGIRLMNAPVNPSINNNIKGDLKPTNFGTEASPRYETDELGNIKVDTTAEPDRADTLKDSEGNDHITSGGGNDNIYLARGGDNWVEAGSGRDWVRGGAGKDLMEGGADADILQGGLGDDRLYAGSQTTVAQAIANGNTQAGTGQQGDFLSGNAGDDIAIGSTADDVLLGGGGNDLLIAGAGDDRMIGDSEWVPTSLNWSVSNNHVFQPVTGETFPSDYGSDVMYGGAGNDYAWGGRGNDVMFGEAGNDLLLGNGDNDALFGGAGQDRLWGDWVEIAGEIEANMGDDYLDGGADDDQLSGGAGSDLLVGGTGNDTLEGGEGQDIYIFNKGDGSDTVIDNKADNNIIRFGEGVLSTDITLRLGSLMLDMGNGDAIHIENFNRDDVYNSVGIGSFEFADGSALNTTELLARGFDLDGTAQDDVLFGTNITDRMRGFVGDDILIGAGGADTLSGGAGNDDLFGDDITIDNTSYALAGTAHGKDYLDGGDGRDQLVGGGNDDTLLGGAGNDKLYGDGDGLAAQYQGNDSLDGGDGDDQLIGNGGDDVLLGGAGNDTLYGGDGNDRLDGGSGVNLLEGGAGNDTYFARAGDSINDTEGQNTFYLDGAKSDFKVQQTEGGLLLSAGNAVEGIFVKDGQLAGHTQLIFSDGVQTSLAVLAGSTLNTQVNASSYEGNAQVFGGLLSDSLYSGGAGSTLTGGQGNDSLTAQGSRSLLNGGQGDDSLFAQGSNQTVQYSRGDGTDTLTGSWNTSGTVIALNGDFKPEDLKLQIDQGQLSVLLGTNQATGQPERMLLNIYASELEGSTLIDRFTFTTDDVQTATLSYADLVARGVQVIGTDGDDYLQGSTVNDEMLGGAGSNTLAGDAGTDTYVITQGSSNRIDDMQGTGEGNSIVKLLGVTSWDDVSLSRPNDGDNQPTNDLLLSVGTGSTATTITVTSALLRAGQFTLALADGQTRSLDDFLADLPGLNITANNTYEADAIQGSSNADVLSGRAGDDRIDGGAGADFVLGGDGTDLLTGGAGDDILLGGAGDDVYVVNLNDGNDQVFDYEGSNTLRFGAGITAAQITVTRPDSSTDVQLSIDGNNSVLIRRALEGSVSSFEFADGTRWVYGDLINRFASPDGLVAAGDDLHNVVDGSSGNDLVLGNRGNDALRGHAGNDELLGGDGDDTLIGGAGSDVLDGGAGRDSYEFALGDGQDKLIDTAGASSICFGQGISLQSLTATRTTIDGQGYTRLAYNPADANDAVLIKDGVLLEGAAFKFADGSQLTQAQVNLVAMQDGLVLPTNTDDADVIYGTAGSDVLDGGLGNDVLEGGAGVDTYRIGANSGRDTLVEALGQSSVVELSQGDAASLSYARSGNSLLVTSAALNSSFYIGNFYAGAGNWTLRTAQGTELDLRALAVAGTAGKSTEQRRDDFYAQLVAQAGPMTVDMAQYWQQPIKPHLFSSPGNWSLTEPDGNQYAYTYQLDKVLLESNDANITAAAQDKTYAWQTQFLETVTRSRTYQVTDVSYNASTQTTPGRTIVIGPNANGADIPGGYFLSFNPVTGLYYLTEPSKSQTTLTPVYTTRTVTENYTQDIYLKKATFTTVVEDVRAGDADNTISLGGAAAKLVTAGGGDDLVTRSDAGSNDFSFDAMAAGPADWVDGGAGNDTIRLGAGNDELTGGAGTDYLDGGAGSDTYVISADDTGWDTVYDSAAAAVQVVFEASFYGAVDPALYARLIDISSPLGGVVASANNLNELMAIYRARPEHDLQYEGYESYNTRTAMQSRGLDQLIANVQGVPFKSYYYNNAPVGYGGDAQELLRPDITFTDAALAPSVNAVKDTVQFGVGITLASLQISWDLQEFDEGTRDVMLISWGGPGGVRVVMPDANMPGAGVEAFTFADGTHLSMAQMLAVAPERPAPLNSISVGTELGTVVALQDAVLAYTLPADAFVITGNKTARFSAKLADTGEPLPEWLHIDPRTGALTGTPQNGDVGTLRVKVTALQAEHQSASQVVTLQIGDANEAPVAVSGAAIEASSVRAGEVLSWALPAGLFTDADANDRLSLRVESADGSALPAWLRLNPVTNRLEGTPTNANAGALALRLVATDLSGAMAFVPFSIDILPGINRSPQVELGILDQQLVETKLWQFTLAANTFVDPDGDALTYSAVLGDGSALPDWMRFDGATQTFSGTPPDTASGLLAITVTATDQQGETASSSFSLDIANIVNGTALSEALAGTSLRDYIDGLAGADTMAGGAGNDTYVVDNAGDVVTENAAEGIDTVMSSVNHILKANAENLTLTGTANIYGLGNELDNLLTGNSGNNILEGGAGIDTMIGGLGDDTYYVSIGDVIIENANEGTDTVVSGINYTLGNNIENLTLSNEMRGLTGTGNGLANRIKGTFYADVIDGGAGADSMTGGRGNDSYYVDNAGDVVAEAANEGTDTVLSSVSYTLSANVKNLTLLGATAINGTGNGTKNILTGNAADNILDGGAGADTLDGGAGADVMLGGKGIDVYIVDNQADTVIESAGEGTDTVYASVSYALTDNVENLVLTGSANINAVGNAGNNRLEGNAGNNILFGGLGNDTYVFGRGSGQDIVANFDAGKPAGDVVQLAAGLADADMDYVRAGNDLLLSIKGTSDQLTVADYFENGGKDDNTLEKIRFADGTSLNHGAVLNRTTAMGRTSVDAEVPEAPGMLAAMRAGDPTSLFDAPAPAASKPSDASITPQSVAESINAARERFEQGLKNLKLGTDELGGLSRGESAARGALPLLWNLQDALLSLQLAKNADGRFTADVSIDSRATRDLGLGISLLGATTGINGRLEQVARPAEVQQFDLAQLH